jgi:uncharacterized protein (DUF1778 family)
MPKGDPQTVYVSAQLSLDEKKILDDAASEAGLSRNAFIRRWITSLRRKA